MGTCFPSPPLPHLPCSHMNMHMGPHPSPTAPDSPVYWPVPIVKYEGHELKTCTGCARQTLSRRRYSQVACGTRCLQPPHHPQHVGQERHVSRGERDPGELLQAHPLQLLTLTAPRNTLPAPACCGAAAGGQGLDIGV